jgi:hypothetical protein
MINRFNFWDAKKVAHTVRCLAANAVGTSTRLATALRRTRHKHATLPRSLAGERTHFNKPALKTAENSCTVNAVQS